MRDMTTRSDGADESSSDLGSQRTRASATGRRTRWPRADRWGVLTAVTLFVVQKAVFLTLLARSSPMDFSSALTRWDAQHFLGIVTEGYRVPSAEQPYSNLAFFPLLPMSARLLSWVTHLPPRFVLIGLAWAGSLAAVWGIHRFVAAEFGDKAAVATVLLWGAAPHALVQVFAYTEGVFTATVAWTLYFMRSRRWTAAAVPASAACLTRPSSSVLLVTLAGVALGRLWQLRRRRAPMRQEVPGLMLMLAAPAACFGAVIAYAGYRTGDPMGYFAIQRRWGSVLGSPWGTWEEIRPYLLSADPAMTPYTRDIGVALALSFVLVLILCLWALWQRRLRAGALFSALVFVLTISTLGYPQAKARFLLPAFPMSMLPGRWIARLPGWFMLLVLAALTTVSVKLDLVIALGRWSP